MMGPPTTVLAVARRLARAARVELARLRQWPRFWLETRGAAGRGSAAGTWVLAAASSPLRRAALVKDERLQAGKERNVALVAARLDGLRLEPGALLSYHRAVGWPARWRGFRAGLELHDGAEAEGVGGGACQVANLLYLLAARGAMTITVRHRHSLDLFPDDNRTVPFGCGATVFYPWADLRFVNPLDQPVSLHLAVIDGELRGELRCAVDPGLTVTIDEVGHRFVRRGDAVWRENQLRRRIVDRAGVVRIDQVLADNQARVAYPVEPARVEASPVEARPR